MGTAYSARQSSYTQGDTINADDTNDEFDAILNAFGTSGHSHDGTAGEGGAIAKLLSNTLTFGAATAGTDITITFDGESNDGVLAWMEDEDYFKFSDDILVNSTEKIMFGDTASFIHQSSDGVLTIDGEATIDLNASTAVLVSNDLKLNSDAAVLGFGADNDVTLTHVADTGVLLNSTMAIQFNDASQYINAPSATVLDINATDEVELNATLVDVNANLDVSGTYTGGGLMTTGGNIVIPNAGNIGSASDTDAISISSGGVVTMNQIPVFSAGINVSGGTIAGTLATAAQTNITSLGTLTTLTVDDITINGSTISDGGDLTIDSAGDINFDADGGNIYFKDGGTTIGSLNNTGNNLRIVSNVSDADMIFRGVDNAAGINALTLDMSDAGTAKFNHDLKLENDGAIIYFGANLDITQTHVHNVGLDWESSRSGSDSIFRFKNIANASASDIRLVLQTGGTSGGDPLINFDGQATNARWSMGVDTSATKFVIADADKGGFDGSDEVFTIATGGNASFASKVLIGSGATGSIGGSLEVITGSTGATGTFGGASGDELYIMNRAAGIVGFQTNSSDTLESKSNTISFIDQSNAAIATFTGSSATFAGTLAAGITTLSTSTTSHLLNLVSTEAGSGTGPVLEFYRNSASPASSDALGWLEFYGEEATSSDKVRYAQFGAKAYDVTNTSFDGEFLWQMALAGSLTEVLRISPIGFTFNESGADVDFRVESDGNANMLFVDGGNNRVGIGTASPASLLHLDQGSG